MSSNRIMAEEPIEKKITRILLHKKMTVTALRKRQMQMPLLLRRGLPDPEAEQKKNR